MKIPFNDLRSQYESISQPIKTSIDRVLEHGIFINGPEVKEFEEKLCSFTSVKHAITCANGTDALTIALLGMGGLRSFEKSKGVARENMKK